MFKFMAAVGLAFCFSMASAADEPRTVSIESGGVPLGGLLFEPKGPIKGVVVALHGCSGLWSVAKGKGDQLGERHRAMGERLSDARHGYAVVFIDSFKARGLGSQCSVSAKNRVVDHKARAVDAWAAIDWARGQPWGNAQPMALLGWSNGAMASLEANNALGAAKAKKPVDAVALFYPGCGSFVGRPYKPSAPAHMFLGALDDWTPAEPCELLAGQGGMLSKRYQGAYHDFDDPREGVRVLESVKTKAAPAGVHAGGNREARMASYMDMDLWLEEKFEAARRAASK